MSVRFYRCIRNESPREDDFVSNDSLGRPCIDDELLPLWTGISCQATEAQARKQASRLPGMRFIAVLEVPLTNEVRYVRTLRKAGHHTLWGTPQQILDLVVDVIAVS